MPRRHALVFAVGSVLALAACGATPPVVTAADAARANVQLADLQEGRTLLLAKCSGCHVAPLPASHPAAQWPHEVAVMTDRSKINEAQRHLIELYLVTMAMH